MHQDPISTIHCGVTQSAFV